MDKVLTSTMGMMTKESHPFSINPQLRAADSSSQSEDMNFDIDNEAISYSQPCDSFLSPTKPPLLDTVDWANSQPVALKSLLSEVRKIPEKSRINYDPTWPSSDSSFDQVPSTSRAPLEVKPRPLRRTNSSARARLGPETASTSSNPPPAPDGDFWCKDRLTILVACQNVSERMDENAFALAAQVHATAPPQPSYKRKPQGPYLTDTAKTKRTSSMSYPVVHDRASISRWEKSKQRVGPLSETVPAGPNRQRLTSVPVVARKLQRVASSSSSSGPSTDFSSLESPDISMMDIETDADLEDETPPTSLPVPVVRSLTRPPQHRAFIRSNSTSTDTATQPQIHLHPLLTQKQQKPKSDPSLNTAKQPVTPAQNKPLPPLQAPPLSQSTRPPPLGMRRAHPAPVTTTTHALPTRQRAFKPPLLSQPAHTQVQAQANAEVNSKLRTRPPEREISPEPELEPETNGEADSSFGDISLGVDDDELELTMRQYD